LVQVENRPGICAFSNVLLFTDVEQNPDRNKYKSQNQECGKDKVDKKPPIGVAVFRKNGKQKQYKYKDQAVG
jgi:hypothetical protein